MAAVSRPNASTPARRAALWALVGTIAVLGAVALAWAIVNLPADRLGEVALFFALAVACQRMPVPLFRNSSISVAFAVAVGALVFLGPAAAVLVQLGPGLVLCVTPYVKPPQKMLFNAASLPLETALAASLYLLLGGVIGASALEWQLMPPVLAASALFVCLNTAALAAAIALETGSSLKAVWTLNYRWLLPNYLGLGLVGVGIGVAAALVGPAGLAVFLVPLGMAWYSFKLYMAQTLEVRKRNQQLQQANAQLDLANARLAQRVTELHALNKIGLSLNGSLDLADLLGEVLTSTLHLVPGASAAVLLSDPATGRISLAASIGLPNGAGDTLASFDSAATRAFASGEEVAIEQTDAALRAIGIEALICQPLRFNGVVSGVFAVGFERRHDWTGEERLLLTSLSQQAAAAVHNARLYQEIEAGYLSTVQAMVAVVDSRERYAQGHAERVRAYAAAAGRQLHLDPRHLATLELAALFHDLGHVGVPEAVLDKPGALSPDEWALVRKHPLLGVSILKQVPRMDAVAQVIAQHHERYDGQGYPNGLLGDDASLLAQVLAVADAYEAMTAARPHRPALPRDQALAELARNAGSQFAPKVVDAFVAATTETTALPSPISQSALLALLRAEPTPA